MAQIAKLKAEKALLKNDLRGKGSAGAQTKQEAEQETETT